MLSRRTRSLLRSIALALAYSGAAFGPTGAAAQSDEKTLQEIERSRQALLDGNPAELVVARGEELWKSPRGPKKVSLEQCDIGLGAGVLKGAYAQLPRYFADVDQVMDFEARLVHCMVTLQGLDRAEVVKNPGQNQEEAGVPRSPRPPCAWEQAEMRSCFFRPRQAWAGRPAWTESRPGSSCTMPAPSENIPAYGSRILFCAKLFWISVFV